MEEAQAVLFPEALVFMDYGLSFFFWNLYFVVETVSKCTNKKHDGGAFIPSRRVSTSFKVT
jgi:hypothetical protein